VSSILLRSLFYRGGGLIIPPVSRVFRGAGDVDVDVGAGTIDDDPMAMYLGYDGV
jgi:hypothetical protein